MRREIPFKGTEREAALVLGSEGQQPHGPHPNPAPRDPSLGNEPARSISLKIQFMVKTVGAGCAISGVPTDTQP